MGEARTQLTGFCSLRRGFLHFPLTFSHTPKTILMIIKESFLNDTEYILIHRQSHFQNNPFDGQYGESYDKPVPSVGWQWHVLKRDTIFSVLRLFHLILDWSMSTCFITNRVGNLMDNFKWWIWSKLWKASAQCGMAVTCFETWYYFFSLTNHCNRLFRLILDWSVSSWHCQHVSSQTL